MVQRVGMVPDLVDWLQRLEAPVILPNGEAIVTSTFTKQLIGGIERQFSPPAIPPNYPHWHPQVGTFATSRPSYAARPVQAIVVGIVGKFRRDRNGHVMHLHDRSHVPRLAG